MGLGTPRTPSRLRFTAAAAFALFLFGCSQNPQTQTKTQPASAASKVSETERSTSTASTVTAKPDEKSDSKALAAKVLMRPDFIGKDKICYTIAKQIPEVLQKLFCHCGCDYTEEHSTLLDCYFSDHTVDCSECKGEALMAFRMNRKGASVAEIQKAIDLNWAPANEFEKEPTEALRKYWRTRLWAPGSGPTPAEKYNKDHTPIDPFTGSQDETSKKTDLQSGSCCSGSKDMKTAKTTKQ